MRLLAASRHKKRFSTLTIILMSLFGHAYTLHTQQTYSLANWSFALIATSVAVYGVLTANYEKLHIRISEMMLGGGFALAISIGCTLVGERVDLLWSWRTLLSFLCLAPVYIISTNVICNALVSRDTKSPRSAPASIGLSSQHLFAIGLILILLAWIPIFLATYPGVYHYDAPSQTAQALGMRELTTHHPVFHTLILKFFLKIGRMWFGSHIMGAGLYTAFQMIVLAAIFSQTCIELFEVWGIRPWIVAVTWFAFCPLVSLQSVAFTKDVLFSGAFCACMLYMSRVLRITCVSPSRGDSFLFCISLLLCMLLRNNAVFAVLAVCFLALIGVGLKKINGHHERACFISLTIALILYALINGPVYGLLGAKSPTTLRETLSVPMQQLARAALYGNIREEDLDYINELLPDYKSYRPEVSDPVKKTFNTQLVTSSPAGFIGHYLSIGTDNAQAYIDAFLLLTCRSWHPFTPNTYKLENQGIPLHSSEASEWAPGTAIQATSKNPEVLSAISTLVAPNKEYARNWWADVPILSVLLSTGGIVWAYLALLLFATKRPKKALRMLVLALPLLYWATLLFGPITLARYDICLFTALPLCLMVAFSGRDIK